MWAILFSFSCSGDSPPDGRTGSKDAVAQDSAGIDTSAIDTSTVGVETCNGVDDDGDTVIDEGFADHDVDGTADCVDGGCTALAPKAASLPTDVSCQPSVANPWSVSVLWQASAPKTSPSSNRSYTTPAVAQLNDDNGDGAVDARDTPDVIVAPGLGGHDVTLWALSGTDGTEEWVSPDYGTALAILVVDAEGKGFPDIMTVTTGGSGTFVLRRVDGRSGLAVWSQPFPEWTARALFDGVQALTAADVDGDGIPEVVTEAGVYSASDGVLLFTLSPEEDLPLNGYSGRGVTAGDIDNDGAVELLVGATVYNADGSVRWKVSPNAFQWSALVQADADADAEVWMLGDTLELYDTDGSALASTDSSFSFAPGQPSVADFDGDRMSDIAFADGRTLYMVSLDGIVQWTRDEGDGSGGLAGTVAWDLDGDGISEILFASEYDFYVFDGPSGAVRVDDQTHRSLTFGEAPVVADVNGDGSAEILYVNMGITEATGSMLTVLGHTGGTGWPSGDGLWPSPDYAIDNIGEAGQVPPPTDWWNTRGMYRAKPAGTLPNGANLRAAITDVCVASCDAANGLANVEVQLSNVGPNDAPGDTSVTLYRDDGVVLATLTVADPIPSGTAGDGFTFTIDANAVGAHGLRAVVDDDGSGVGAVGECDETDNAGVWETPLCP